MSMGQDFNEREGTPTAIEKIVVAATVAGGTLLIIADLFNAIKGLL